MGLLLGSSAGTTSLRAGLFGPEGDCVSIARRKDRLDTPALDRFGTQVPPTVHPPVTASQMLYRYAARTIAEFRNRGLLAGAPHHTTLANGLRSPTIAELASHLDAEGAVV